MSRYSELLTKRMENCGYTPAELARQIGVDRSYIVKNKMGTGVIQDVKKAERLFNLLPQTDEEARELFDAYCEARYGDKRHNMDLAVKEFLSSFQHASELNSNMIQRAAMIPDDKCLYGSEDIFFMLQILFSAEAAKEQGHISIIAQPDHRRLVEPLKTVFRMESDCKVEHLICLEKTYEDKTSKYKNIELFEKLVPVILNQKSGTYTVGYYYDQITSHLNRFNLFPYAFITSECVMIVSSMYDQAIVYRELEIVKSYEMAFQKMFTGSKVLYQSLKDEGNYIERVVGEQLPEKNVYFMGPQPCLGTLNTGGLFDKYVIDDAEVKKVVELLKAKKIADHAAFLKGTQQVTAFFTKAGIRRMLNEGIYDELPTGIYKPIQKKDTCRLLREILNYSRRGRYHVYLINERKFAYPQGLVIDIFEKTHADLIYNAENRERRFLINEVSISSLLFDFIHGFESSPYVYTEEETVAWLEEQIRQAEESVNPE
ncbi:MAG: helix-turn-helix domain-containing protein [Lachnospiraceae bacterium]|nr:helix-turn-helix domain-containing protein [Lachnospiraceae bacterium]